MNNKRKKQEGITLLVTLLLMGVLLGVSASLLNITLKQFQLSGVGYSSEVAFQAANAGMECALYRDWVSKEYDIGALRNAVQCFSSVSSSDIGSDPNTNGTVDSGEEQLFQYAWGTNPQKCSQISVYKFFNATAPVNLLINGVDVRPSSDCPANTICTVIQARGYNVACAVTTTASRVVEREYTQIYQTAAN
jgi:hypothetical protein